MIAASVVVVSRHRAEALTRCLTALTQQDHPHFEVVVVADPAGIAAARATGLRLRLAAFDEPNISAARNIGISLAAGAVIAFIDDDAVAEPTWLSKLCAPFGDVLVVASTGFVRGRNGISFQWRAAEVDQFGRDHPLAVHDAGEVRQGTPQRAVKTQGTNCAFRADTLRAIGGFDPAYRFFLDEADVNLRLARHGATAIVPHAEVHHGYAASDRRGENRVPLDLTEIAASTAVFLRRHAPDADPAPHWLHLRAEQAARLKTHRRAGRLDSAREEALLRSLETGWTDGLSRDLPSLQPVSRPDYAVDPLPETGPKPGVVISGLRWNRASLQVRAAREAASGRIVTVLCLSLTARAHRITYQPGGFWWQEGGLFGRSDRATRRFRLITRARRVAQEAVRWAKVRPVT